MKHLKSVHKLQIFTIPNWKEFFHIFRDTRTMLILFGLPIAQILIFGYVVTNELKDIKVAVVDLSRDNVTDAITDKIFSSGYFILDAYYTGPVDVDAIFKKGDVKEVVVFGQDFAGKLERGEGAEKARHMCNSLQMLPMPIQQTSW